MADRTQVAIIGAGPAGLLLGQLLGRAGVETVIVERRSRAYCEARIRAGVLEQATRELLIEAGVGERMRREGLVHGGIRLHFDAESHRIAIDELTGGRTVTIYGQTEVVKDLIAARLASGAPIVFDAADVRVAGVGGDAPVVSYRTGDSTAELHADFVAGCDGFHGVCRTLAGADAQDDLGAGVSVRVARDPRRRAALDRRADLCPPPAWLRAAQHAFGDGQPALSPGGARRGPWGLEPTIGSGTSSRFACTPTASRSSAGPIREKSVTPMRSFVAAPMRHGRLLLAGDAAHIVPPTGAKGLNLAVADVAVLADAFDAHYATGSDTGLDGYSDRCLRRVWRAQHFSWWMTSMLHVDPGDDAYGAQLARSQLRYVCTSPAAATTLAENYVGLPHEFAARR